MRQSLSLGRIFGIEVRVHATWLLAFAFITWGLANGYFRFITPRQGLGMPLLLGALSAVDDYLSKRALSLFAPVIDHLREVGEARSATEIEDHFKRNFGIEGVTGVCEYLADQGIIGKAPLSVRLTKKSNVDVEELAFFYSTRSDDF